MKKTDGEEVTKIFNSQVSEKLHGSNHISEFCHQQVEHFIEYMETFLEKGSGWIFEEIKSVNLQYSKSKKTRAGSYIETPERLASKKAIINIQNDDNRCIDYCIIYHKISNRFKCVESLLADENCQDKTELEKEFKQLKKVMKRPHEIHVYKKYMGIVKVPEGMTYPIDIQTDIKKYERLNEMQINVFENVSKKDGDKLLPVYHSSEKKNDVMNIMILYSKQETETKEHLVVIKAMQRLMNREAGDKERYFCSNCISTSFLSKEKLPQTSPRNMYEP